MTTMNAEQESVMSRVTKLLALAADEGASPHERKLAEERAEKLMAQHMIDRFEAAERAKHGGTQARKPVETTWDIQMTDIKMDGADSSWEFQNQLVDIMMYVTEHCNIRVNRSYKYVNGNRRYQLVGFPEDIMYAERIWFNVFKTFVDNVNPHWDKSKPLAWNAYTFASAGVAWKNIVFMAEDALDTRLEWPQRFQNDDPNKPFYTGYGWIAGDMVERHPDNNNKWNPPLDRSIKKLRKLVKQYCADNNVEYPYAAGSKLRVATRNSFARSYRSTIQRRLHEIRDEATGGVEHVDAGKFAIALRDTRERVDEEFYRLFPQYDPEVQRKKMEEAEFLRACDWAALSPEEQRKVLRDEARENAKWQRNALKARRSYRAIREDPANRIDGAAWARGKSAAESVNLRADSEVNNQERKGIK